LEYLRNVASKGPKRGVKLTTLDARRSIGVVLPRTRVFERNHTWSLRLALEDPTRAPTV
jgi:hypothetical protein